MKFLTLLPAYLKKNWLLSLLLGGYTLALGLNAAGWPVWLPGCPVKTLTGVECWGCGLNRAAIALLSGHWQEALEHNALIFVYVPLVAGVILYDFYKFYVQPNPKLT